MPECGAQIVGAGASKGLMCVGYRGFGLDPTHSNPDTSAPQIEALWGAEPGRRDNFQRVAAVPVFDFAAFFAAFDAGRRGRGLSWYEFADELWHQSSDLNSHRSDHPL